MKTAPMRWLETFHAAGLIRDLGDQRRHVRERNASKLPYYDPSRGCANAARFELVRRNGEKAARYVGTKGGDLDGTYAVCAWLQEGAQSFSMPQLTPERVRDLRTVKASGLKPPYSAFHLQIPPVDTPEGKVSDIMVHVYSMETHDVLNVTPLVDGEDGPVFLLHTYICLNGEYAKGDNLREAIDTRVSGEMERRIKYPAQKGGVPTTRGYGTAHQECHPATTLAVLPLVIEAMLTISESPAAQVEWEDGAPEDLVARSSRSDQRGVDARMRLTTLGHAPRRTIRHSPAEPTGRTVADHWRRGHERWQRHGPRGSLRKRITVGPTKIGNPPEGRGYVVR